MIRLLAILMARAQTASRAAALRGLAVGVGGSAVADFIDENWLRAEALKVAPGSDSAALNEAARMAARFLGLAGDEILWPRMRNGEPVPANYLTIDLNRGRAWMHGRYYSRKSVSGGRRRGYGRGFRGGQRDARSAVQAAR